MAYKKSFLKWPGGKFRVLPRLLEAFPADGRFVEPFAGSCTVFLNTSYSEYLLCDINSDVIILYNQLAAGGEAFIERCRSLFSARNNTRERYYVLRSVFNSAPSDAERAALFVYCNRHGYNGLVRYNAKGAFNVPFGRYVKPRFPEPEMRAFAEKVRKCSVTFAAQDFMATFNALRGGDVVYCDPPYAPLSSTANFTSYSGLEFGMNQQRALASRAREAAQRGISVFLSNHDLPETRALYASAAWIRSFPIRRSISCKGKARGFAAELMAAFL